MVIRIREATREDVDVIYAMIIAIARYHDQEKYVKTDRAEIMKSGFGLSPDFKVLLAEVDSEAAGFLSYTWNYSIWRGETYMSIDDIFILERYRGEKIGETLMFKAREICRFQGIKQLRWEVMEDNQRAIKFYRRLGVEVGFKGVCRWNLEE